ncbi:DUF1801 domain-containing protein [Candidatus Saccharibacteria bacterium]|nr:DUF1801 domain-containing protein [Candidatus Saccharibacteria bacterium]
MNMFKLVGAKSVEEYFALLNDERREQLEIIDKLIQETVPTLKPWFAYNMIGYGEFDYVDYKKQPGKWPVIALASQKNYMSLYVCAINNQNPDQYLVEKYEQELGKVNVGKSCIRFKKIGDLNLETVKKVLREAKKTPGLVGSK